MMRVEQKIVAAWAARLSSQAISDVIRSFEEMEASLSGDSGLKNAWEEVCVQVQGEESADWSLYEDAIEEVLYPIVEELAWEAQLALWAVTDEGWEYLYDHHADQNGIAEVPINIGDIISMLMNKVRSVAEDYESRSLYRYLWGSDDDENEDEESDTADNDV